MFKNILFYVLIVFCSESCFKTKVDQLVINASNLTTQAIAINNKIIINFGAEHWVRNKYNGRKIVDAQKQYICPLMNVFAPINASELTDLKKYQFSLLQQGIGSIYISFSSLEDFLIFQKKQKIKPHLLTYYSLIKIKNKQELHKLEHLTSNNKMFLDLHNNLVDSLTNSEEIKILLNLSAQLIIKDYFLIKKTNFRQHLFKELAKNNNHKILITCQSKTPYSPAFYTLLQSYSLIPLIKVTTTNLKSNTPLLKKLYTANKGIILQFNPFLKIAPLFASLPTNKNNTFSLPSFLSKQFMFKQFTEFMTTLLKTSIPHAIEINQKVSFCTINFLYPMINEKNQNKFLVSKAFIGNKIIHLSNK